MKRFVITGCGRSGTQFSSKIFTAAGVPCRHEVACQAGGFKGYDGFPGEASWFAAAYLQSLPDDIVVIHQVRDPEAVAKSWYRIGLFAATPLITVCRGDFSAPHLARMGKEPRSTFQRWKYVRDQRRLVKQASSVFSAETEAMRCVTYWAEWNRLVEKSSKGRPIHRLRIEDLGPAAWKELGDFLEADLGPLPAVEVANRKSRYPERPFPRTEIPADVARMAADYHYDLPAQI